MAKYISVITNLQTNCCLKLDFKNEYQRIGGKCFILGMKHKDYQMQSLELPSRISQLRI